MEVSTAVHKNINNSTPSLEKQLPYPRYISKDFMRRLVSKPFSLIMFLLSLGMIAFAVYGWLHGDIYVARLNYVDSSTLVFVGLLLLRAITKLEKQSDLQTVSIGLVSVISFIFAYEALYKLSFYFFPWRMSPEELRAFIIQVAVSLVVLAGFAQGIFRFTRGSKIALAAFIVLWVIWLAVGFPQLWDGLNVYSPLIGVPSSWGMIYALNRLTKVALFLFYYLLYA